MIKRIWKGFCSLCAFYGAPFRILKVERVYLPWIAIMIVSFSGCILDWFNGEIRNNLSQGILYCTSFAVVAPYLVEFAVDFSNRHRQGIKEEFTEYKSNAFFLCFIMTVMLFFLYSTKVRADIRVQVIVTMTVFGLSFYTNLIKRMDSHSKLFEDCKDKEFAEADKEVIKSMKIKASQLTVTKDENGNEVEL